jgi:hypothetical protein
MVKFTSIRVLLAIIVIRYLEVYQVDFKNAFLNGDLNEIIFMEQLDGQVLERQEKLVCKKIFIWAKVKLKNLVPKVKQFHCRK